MKLKKQKELLGKVKMVEADVVVKRDKFIFYLFSTKEDVTIAVEVKDNRYLLGRCNVNGFYTIGQCAVRFDRKSK